MRLSLKISLIIACVVGLSGGLSFLIVDQTIYPSFVQLEDAKAEENLNRVVRAVESEVHHLDTLTYDWAVWDDTYQYVVDQNEEYLQSNLNVTSFSGSDLDLIYIYDATGKRVYGESYDQENEAFIDIAEFSHVDLPADHYLLKHESVESRINGIMLTSVGPMMISSHPILTSEAEGPIRGTLVMGRILNETRIAALAKQVQIDADIWAVDSESIPPGARALLAGGTPEARSTQSVGGSDVLQLYTVLNEISGAPALIVGANTARDITGIGRETVNYAMISLLLVGAVVMFILYVLLHVVVVKPVAELKDVALSIRRSGDMSYRINTQRSDEIGTLADEFEKMLQALTEARLQLTEDSYMSGMARTAAGVMHNVRNQMQPVMLELGRIVEGLERRSRGKMKAAIAELGDPEIDGERKRKLIDYVDMAVDEFTAGDRKLIDDLSGMTTQVAEVDGILSQHNGAAYAERVVGRTSIADALRMARNVVAGDKTLVAIEEAAGIGDLPAVNIDSTILSQLLGNLLLNAERAIELAGNTAGEVKVTGSNTTKDGTPMVHVTVRDNGIGMDEETSQKIFGRGFTTKEDCKGGLGLHWCANELRSVGGMIWAESAGVGKGAAFHIEIPRAEQVALEPAE